MFLLQKESQSLKKNNGKKFSVLFSEFNFCFSAADLDGEELQEASSQQGPLPDLLPQNEHPSWASQHHREAAQELEVSRLANQLRAIGDEFNTTVLRRAVRLHCVIYSVLKLLFMFCGGRGLQTKLERSETDHKKKKK